MSKKIPAGYRWELESYADEEGLVINVILVSSPYKKGSWKDKLFQRKVITSTVEAELTATVEEIDALTDNAKNQLASMFFRPYIR